MGMLDNLKNIKLTKQQKNNIAAVVFIGGFAIFAYVKWWFGPLITKYSEKITIFEEKEKELKDAKIMVSKYAEFMQKQHEINTKVDFINRRLPKDANMSDTIREITNKATENNINIVNFEPGKEYNRGQYKETEVTVYFETNYNDLGNFVSGIGYIERLTTPAKFSIIKLDKTMNATSPGKKNIIVEMMVKIYSFVE